MCCKATQIPLKTLGLHLINTFSENYFSYPTPQKITYINKNSGNSFSAHYIGFMQSNTHQEIALESRNFVCVMNGICDTVENSGGNNFGVITKIYVMRSRYYTT